MKVVSDEVFREFVKACNFLRQCRSADGILYLICAKDNVNTMMSEAEIVLMARIIINKMKVRLIGREEDIEVEELRTVR